jgi:murein L,D-transpeptidase YcbB/YkuD
MKPFYDMTMNELANHFMNEGSIMDDLLKEEQRWRRMEDYYDQKQEQEANMDDWQAAQHADDLLLQKQVLDSLQMLYISSKHPGAYEACLTVAGALGLAKDFEWMNGPKAS